MGVIKFNLLWPLMWNTCNGSGEKLKNFSLRASQYFKLSHSKCCLSYCPLWLWTWPLSLSSWKFEGEMEETEISTQGIWKCRVVFLWLCCPWHPGSHLKHMDTVLHPLLHQDWRHALFFSSWPNQCIGVHQFMENIIKQCLLQNKPILKGPMSCSTYYKATFMQNTNRYIGKHVYIRTLVDELYTEHKLTWKWRYVTVYISTPE